MPPPPFPRPGHSVISISFLRQPLSPDDPAAAGEGGTCGRMSVPRSGRAGGSHSTGSPSQGPLGTWGSRLCVCSVPRQSHRPGSGSRSVLSRSGPGVRDPAPTALVPRAPLPVSSQLVLLCVSVLTSRRTLVTVGYSHPHGLLLPQLPRNTSAPDGPVLWS
uniref:Uncharacterized protein n=1 Tax=Molossus molossus TaxID=27622 RepID=A0A7J8FYB1_MOLMO|nr:hypothetical protein HJG59_008139 [Molossus molossus]